MWPDKTHCFSSTGVSDLNLKENNFVLLMAAITEYLLRTVELSPKMVWCVCWSVKENNLFLTDCELFTSIDIYYVLNYQFCLNLRIYSEIIIVLLVAANPENQGPPPPPPLSLLLPLTILLPWKRTRWLRSIPAAQTAPLYGKHVCEIDSRM